VKRRPKEDAVTGKIEILATLNKPGWITSNSGASKFHYRYRLPLGQMDGLHKGCLVSFELEKGSPVMAVSVCVKDSTEFPLGAQNLRREIRYSGFEQSHNIRTYKFQAWQAGEENQEAVVTVDLALFRKYGITIQEGPSLCLRLLQEELSQSSPSKSPVWERALTDKEMLAHRARRPTSSKR